MESIFERANAVPVASVLGSYGVPKHRENHKWRCVACANKRALHVYAANNRAHCFSCGRGFSSIDIVIELDGVSPLQAAKTLVGEPVTGTRSRRQPSSSNRRTKIQTADDDQVGEPSNPADNERRRHLLKTIYAEMRWDNCLLEWAAESLESRGIDGGFAYDMGVRAASGLQWRQLREHYGTQSLEQLGFINSKGGLHPWYDYFLIFPYRDADGELEAFRFRTIFDEETKVLSPCGEGRQPSALDHKFRPMAPHANDRGQRAEKNETCGSG